MTNKVDITIITVVYNGVDSLQRTIDSVVNIKDYNISFYIIDGGSNDGTVDIIKNNSKNITYWLSEPDKGIYDAMNKGWVKASPNSYILYLGSGDEVVELPKNLDQYHNDEIIYGDVFLGEHKKFKSVVDWRTYLGNTIHHQAMLVKKSLHPSAPFSLDYKVYSDFDFNQRLVKKGAKFIKDDNFVSFALEGGVSENFNLKECLEIVNKNYGSLMKFFSFLYFKLR